MLSRVVGFGCSMTYGHGLPDCYNYETGDPGPNPSELAWPSLTAKILQVDVLNRAKCGASNKEILHRLLNTSLTSSDIVIIQWSFPARHCIIEAEDIHGVKQIIPGHDINKISESYYGHMYHEYDRLVDTYTCINHAGLYLDAKGIQNYHMVINSDSYRKFDWCTANLLPYNFTGMGRKDNRGLDGKHPGRGVHKNIAFDLHKRII